MKTLLLTAAMALLIAPTLAAQDDDEALDVDISIEYSAADDEAEVLIEFESEDPIRRISVRSPGKKGARVVHLKTKGSHGWGDGVLETGEGTLAEILEQFPEGTYEVMVKTVDGEKLRGEAELSHDLPAAPDVTPADGASVPANDVLVTWDAVEGAEEYVLEIESLEDAEVEVSLLVELPGDVTSFQVPAGLLASGAEYELEVGVENDEDNVTSAESSFTTL